MTATLTKPTDLSTTFACVGGKISGLVQSASGAPVAGVSVAIYLGNLQSVFAAGMSAADGTWTVGAVELGNGPQQAFVAVGGGVPVAINFTKGVGA